MYSASKINTCQTPNSNKKELFCQLAGNFIMQYSTYIDLHIPYIWPLLIYMMHLYCFD